MKQTEFIASIRGLCRLDDEQLAALAAEIVTEQARRRDRALGDSAMAAVRANELNSAILVPQRYVAAQQEAAQSVAEQPVVSPAKKKRSRSKPKPKPAAKASVNAKVAATAVKRPARKR